ncbi:MAG TPA: AraC family transcriptional regulator [Candidatus Saccharimonadales bacterium]|nr:AraC family transcriptional regulator [Candidatus Saccharimonadales bacterium]
MKASTPIGLQGLFWYFPASARDKNWGIYATSIGTTHVAPHKPYPPAGHPGCYDYKWERGRILPVYAVVYISRGRGWIDLNPKTAQRQDLETGNVILLFPGMWHRYCPDPEFGWDEHWVAFDGKVAARWIKECSFSPSQPVLKVQNEETLRGIFAHLIEIGQQSPVALQQLMAAQVHCILATLYSEKQAAVGGGDPAADVVRAVQARMRKGFTSDLNVKQLARESKVSYSWFRHAFVQQTGFSPYQYIVELRLARARDLLVQSSLKIKEIANLSGFADEHYFSRIFKARVGLTPHQWRTQARTET